jgi:hypothetical protein
MVTIDVITYCSGYSYEIFDRFVGTLKDTGFKGNIYIIINKQDIPIIKLLKQKYSNVYPFLDSIPRHTHVNNHRFFCISALLKNVKINSDYLLICDSRDVLFQKNIEEYDYDLNVDLYGFLEGITIENEPTYNGRWLKQLEQILNEQIHEKICKNSVICCGTTIGKTHAIVKYVDMMCDYIYKNKITNNLDQAIHNYMLYFNKLGINIKLLSNEDNLVNTVGIDVQKINNKNLIVNKNDDVSYIVHQYDRFSIELKRRISIASGKYNFVL